MQCRLSGLVPNLSSSVPFRIRIFLKRLGWAVALDSKSHPALARYSRSGEDDPSRWESVHGGGEDLCRGRCGRWKSGHDWPSTSGASCPQDVWKWTVYPKGQRWSATSVTIFAKGGKLWLNLWFCSDAFRFGGDGLVTLDAFVVCARTRRWNLTLCFLAVNFAAAFSGHTFTLKNEAYLENLEMNAIPEKLALIVAYRALPVGIQCNPAKNHSLCKIYRNISDEPLMLCRTHLTWTMSLVNSTQKIPKVLDLCSPPPRLYITVYMKALTALTSAGTWKLDDKRMWQIVRIYP